MKNAGLRKNLFSKIKQEFHDIDYAHKLGEEDKEWLSKFMDEDLGANFKDGGESIYKDDADRKASYTRNNARNRDIYAQSRAQGKLIFDDFSPEPSEDDPTYDPTEDLIDMLDEEKD